MPWIEHSWLLLLAPVAGLAAWLVATRGRRGRTLRGAGAALAAALFIIALAGIGIGKGVATRVFLVDVSASTRGATAALLPRIRAAAAGLRPTDRAAVVVFGRDAAVLLPLTPAAELPPELPAPVGVDQDGTSIERGVETALALLPAGSAGDLVLVTDGVETRGDAASLAGRLAAERRMAHSLTLVTAPKSDAWVEAIRAPGAAAAGRPVDFEVIVGATEPTRGKLILLVNGRELARPESVDVLTRRVVLARRLTAPTPGLIRLTARLLCPGDTTSENDEAAAAVRVSGKLNVTLVSADGDRALAGVLEKAGAVRLRRVTPPALAPTNEEMLRSDVIVLDDVPFAEIGADRAAWLRRFVRDAGRGLVVFGGRDAFGPGGYARTPLGDLLPVDSDPERRAARPSSVVIVADRSGSMAERLDGRPKIEFVREAVLRAGTEFGARRGGQSDELSVVAFSQVPEVLLERHRAGGASGMAALRAAVARMFPSGRTRIGPALDAAVDILKKAFLRRHVILVSDGESQDRLDGAAIARAMRAHAAVLSVLATGRAMNDGLTALRAVAKATGGRFVLLDTISDLPAAMARETRTIAGSLVRESKAGFKVTRGPGAWLGSLPDPPPVTGYVLTGARKPAPPLLVTGTAPILAAWRRGLGRVAACTTSPQDWAAEWTTDVPGLFASLVEWAGAGQRPAGVAVQLDPEDRRVRITVDTAEPMGDRELAASVFPPEGRTVAVTLRRTGRLRYEGSFEAARRGTYVATIVDAKTGEAVGESHVTVGTSAEWRAGGDATTAKRLSRLTGGAVLGGLDELPPLRQAQGPGDEARRNLAWALLLAAAAAFVVSSLK